MPREPVPDQSKHVFVENSMTSSGGVPAPHAICGECGQRYDGPVHVFVDGTPVAAWLAERADVVIPDVGPAGALPAGEVVALGDWVRRRRVSAASDEEQR